MENSVTLFRDHHHHHLHRYIPVRVWCRRLCMRLLHAYRQLVFVFTFEETMVRGGEDGDWLQS